MRLELHPVRVNTGTADEEGQLVFIADRLVAVLVRLSDQHDGASGQWFLEHGFGRLGSLAQQTFDDLDAAERWILGRLGQRQ